MVNSSWTWSTRSVHCSHDTNADGQEVLARFGASTHPYDQWFVEQLTDLHDFEHAGQAQELLDFEVVS
jgi:hypothetical protein